MFWYHVDVGVHFLGWSALEAVCVADVQVPRGHSVRSYRVGWAWDGDWLRWVSERSVVYFEVVFVSLGWWLALFAPFFSDTFCYYSVWFCAGRVFGHKLCPCSVVGVGGLQKVMEFLGYSVLVWSVSGAVGQVPVVVGLVLYVLY